MTVMSTATRELDINTILLRSFQLASQMPMEASASGTQWDARAAFGRDMLEMVVDHIQAEGNITRDVELYSITLTDGTASYTMPTDTLRVSGVAMYQETSSDPETQVTEMSREDYQVISDKDTEGSPSRYYATRGSSVVVYPYPVPDTSAATLVVQRQRLLMDNTSGTATVDLERSWVKWLVWEVAHQIAVASGLPEARCGYLRSGAEKLLASCKMTSQQGTSTQAYMMHDGGVR